MGASQAVGPPGFGYYLLLKPSAAA